MKREANSPVSDNPPSAGVHPSLEIHIPISPTPYFFNMVRSLIHSLRRFGGSYRDAPVVVTVGAENLDSSIFERTFWLRGLGAEVRLVPAEVYAQDSHFGTAVERFRHDFQADVVLMLDADVLVASPFDELVEMVFREQVFAGVIAMVSPFQFSPGNITWQRLYDYCGLGTAKLDHQHPGWPIMHSKDPIYQRCPAYFNLGVLCAPRKIMRQIGAEIFPLMHQAAELMPGTPFRCQLALSLAITKLSLPYRCLPMRYNFGNAPPMAVAQASELPHTRFAHWLCIDEIHKWDVYGSWSNVEAFLERSDLSGVNRIMQNVLASIYPAIRDEVRCESLE